MRILVTGGSGFLGSYLVADLLANGHQVAVLVRPGNTPWRLQEYLRQLVQIDGTFDDIDALRAALADFQPEAVAHLGWRGVGNGVRNAPMQARNIVDAVDMAALASEVGAKIFVGAGSQAEYGPYDRMIAADDATHPTTLYGKAKLAAGSMVAQIAADAGMRFAWLRVFSTYGPKDADHWLIPTAIRTIAAGERMSLTACEQRWGFLHARDAAAAFRIALEKPDAIGIFNVGHPEAPALRDTLMKLRDLVDPVAQLGIGDVPYRRDQVMVLQADTSRLQALGWAPSVSLEPGLRETVDWYVASKPH